jgi:predicted acylesterase/phospholipase RssA
MKADFVGSGTGANFPIVAGAMDAFLEHGVEPRTLTATSGAGLTFGPMSVGNHPREVKRLAREIGILGIVRKNWRPFTPGIFHLDRLVSALKPLTPPTFKDCDVPLTVVAADSDTGDAYYLSKTTTPDICVARAIQASASVPWLFRHVKVAGMRMVDGGIVDNFAIDHPRSPMVIGIRVLGSRSEMRPWSWWPSYSANILATMMLALEREHVEDVVWDATKILTINSHIGGMDFHRLDSTTIDRLYDTGYQAAKKRLGRGWLS